MLGRRRRNDSDSRRARRTLRCRRCCHRRSEVRSCPASTLRPRRSACRRLRSSPGRDSGRRNARHTRSCRPRTRACRLRRRSRSQSRKPCRSRHSLQRHSGLRRTGRRNSCVENRSAHRAACSSRSASRCFHKQRWSHRPRSQVGSERVFERARPPRADESRGRFAHLALRPAASNQEPPHWKSVETGRKRRAFLRQILRFVRAAS